MARRSTTIEQLEGRLLLATQSFSNSAFITINDSFYVPTTATPYPSGINVSGVSGAIEKVTVQLKSFGHSKPKDVDVLLVGPTGDSVILMSDAGMNFAVSNVTLTFDDSGARLPDLSQITTGTYRPTNHDGFDDDDFPSPAPGGPTDTRLSVFNNQNANGAWSLYVADDEWSGSGQISTGWSITIQSSDVVPYTAAPHTYESLDLVEGGAGVVKLLDNADDGRASIDLGGDTFSFYGAQYTGSNQLYVSTNGLITFGGTYGDDWSNSDLTTAPPQAAIAPLWDDWRTDAGTSPTNSCVLYKFDSPNGRLIIEWNDVPHFNGGNGSGPVTFQAILQLNTGGAPGRIIFNYPDLDASVVTINNGGEATVGIKASGSQGDNRLLVSYNNGSHPWLGSGKAIRIEVDVTPPLVSSSGSEYLTRQAVNFTFSEDVSASLSTGDFVVQNVTTSTTIPAGQMSVAYDGPSNTATLTFPGVPGGLLSNGNYRATLLAGSVQDAAGNPLAADASVEFFVLAGDANHDRAVDISDLGILATNWQQSPRNYAQGDFNYSAGVEISDLGLLATYWQQTLPAPSLPAGITTSAQLRAGATLPRSKAAAAATARGTLALLPELVAPV